MKIGKPRIYSGGVSMKKRVRKIMPLAMTSDCHNVSYNVDEVVKGVKE
jgi:hypothetical protein